MTAALEFVGHDLPERVRGGRGPSKGTLEMLRAIHKRPGEWAFVPDARPGSASTLHQRYGIDAVVRTVDGKKCLYVRWPLGMRVPKGLDL